MKIRYGMHTFSFSENSYNGVHPAAGDVTSIFLSTFEILVLREGETQALRLKASVGLCSYLYLGLAVGSPSQRSCNHTHGLNLILRI
jgi:hypothetical protein